MSAERQVFVQCAADARQRWARHWLIERRAAAPTRPLALVTDHLAAAGDLLHPIVLEPDRSGRTHRGLFLVHRFTLDLLALELCRLELSRRQSVQVTPTARRALVGRVLHEAAERLCYFAPVAATPGFVRVLARTLDELRLHGLSGAHLDELGGEHAACS